MKLWCTSAHPLVGPFAFYNKGLMEHIVYPPQLHKCMLLESCLSLSMNTFSVLPVHVHRGSRHTMKRKRIVGSASTVVVILQLLY